MNIHGTLSVPEIELPENLIFRYWLLKCSEISKYELGIKSIKTRKPKKKDK